MVALQWPIPRPSSCARCWFVTAIMKGEIYRLYPELEHAADTEDILCQLIEAAKEAWHQIDQAVLNNLSITMSHRVEAVLKAEGWYTKY
jgi:hypothetical protein